MLQKGKPMSDLIDRQAAIDAIMGEPTDAHYPSWYAAQIEQLPSAQQERIIYGNMSDEEFEKWLYEHGICSPNIHESIPCDAVPLLIDNAISELPSAQPEQRWIPCSERLPEERDWYLGIFKEPDTGWINPIPFICDYVGSETKATTKEYWILRGFTDSDERTDYYFNLECVAWMPLPEPYKGGEQDAEV